MTAKQPTAHAISALLRRSGFQRSTYGDRDVLWDDVTEGYSVWKTRHRDAPDHPYVAVQHVIGGDAREWPERKREMRRRLEEYAAVIRDAGYAPLVRDRGDEPPWLTIMTVA